MARLSQSLPCPACGEPMKVSKGKLAQKVCCPHCRQNVVPEPAPQIALQPEWNIPGAAAQLEDLLTRCREKRRLLETTNEEIASLESQTRALGNWLQMQAPTPEDSPATRMKIDLQLRLFEQLQTLPRGRIALVDCDPQNEKSLANFIRLTFEAFGWSVELHPILRATHCGEEITFVVAPGAVNYSVAAIYMALQSAGIRLHSQIDLDQPEDCALLCVHRISSLPKLLPPPKNATSESAVTPMKKSA